MRCPKCAQEQADNAQICSRCGIVFEKYYKYHPRPGEDDLSGRVLAQEVIPARPAFDWRLLFLYIAPSTTLPMVLARAVLALFLAWFTLVLILSPLDANPAVMSLLHLVNLPFHEAGHVFFSPFGSFLHSLGGTLGQLIMPLICLGVLLVRTRDPFGAAVCLWWFGENFLDIAPYIADARAGVLPLIGGHTGQSAPYGFHDWQYLLTESGLLEWDRALGNFSHFLGSLLMALALVWAGWLLRRQWQVVRPR